LPAVRQHGPEARVAAGYAVAGTAADDVRPIASAYVKYVSTDATTMRASMARSSMPTSEIFAHASITSPRSRIRSTISARPPEPVDWVTLAMSCYLLRDHRVKSGARRSPRRMLRDFRDRS